MRGYSERQISGYALHRLLPEQGYDVAGLLCGSEGGFAATLQAHFAEIFPSADVTHADLLLNLDKFAPAT